MAPERPHEPLRATEDSSMNPWVLLAVCICAEVTGTLLLTKSQGFARPGLGLLSLAIFGACFWGLSIVLTRIPVGVTYAIWAGVGIALISVSGWIFLRQALSPLQIAFIAMIAVGAVGLKLTTTSA
jgi:small multidrug resistance pump